MVPLPVIAVAAVAASPRAQDALINALTFLVLSVIVLIRTNRSAVPDAAKILAEAWLTRVRR